MTLAGWLAYRDRQLSGPDAGAAIDSHIDIVFSALDRDRDGRLTGDDVRRYLGLYGLRESELREILGHIDPDRRGAFTRADLHRLAREYYFSSDETARGNWLLGRF